MQFNADVDPFLYRSSMQAYEDRLNAKCNALKSYSWAVNDRYFKAYPDGDLILASKSARIFSILQELYILERLWETVNRLYQLCKCSIFQKSLWDRFVGRALPRYLSAFSVSQSWFSLVKLRASVQKMAAIFLRKGVQVMTIQLQSVICSFMFFSTQILQFGQDQIRRFLLNLIRYDSWPLGKAQFCSVESVVFVKGGKWYFLSTQMSLGPQLKQQMADACVIALMIDLLDVVAQNSLSFLMYALRLSNGLFYPQSLLQWSPSVWCCLMPTADNSPHCYLVCMPSQQSLRGQRAPDLVTMATCTNLQST